MGALKDGNKQIQITMTPFHITKLNMMCKRTGLSKSQVIQRFIEDKELPGISSEKILAGENNKG